MKGDFTRDTFDVEKHFSRVLMQQGRVQLDADWNEQVSILLHYMRTLAADLIGPYAGPEADWGFNITTPEGQSPDDGFRIGKGRYYVNGILCENKTETSYAEQPDLPGAPRLDNGNHLVYLDVWERHITCIEDNGIREKALGHADTATRAKTIWQVKVKELSGSYYCLNGTGQLNEEEIAISRASLRARARQEHGAAEPCLIQPEARYRGVENQLYRVEIHDGGSVGSGKPTFKWSRENGSVVFSIKTFSVGEDTITLELTDLGRDSRLSLAEGDWVEIGGDGSDLKNETKPLLQVEKIDRSDMTVVLKKKAGVSYSVDMKRHPLLRRWDQKKNVSDEGVMAIKESKDWDGDWLELEKGIRIQFYPYQDPDPIALYRAGDYWMIPARTASGDVEWPADLDAETGRPRTDSQGNVITKFIGPRGVMHHFAPLAAIFADANGVRVLYDCRCRFNPLSYSCPYSYYGQLGIGVDMLEAAQPKKSEGVKTRAKRKKRK